MWYYIFLDLPLFLKKGVLWELIDKSGNILYKFGDNLFLKQLWFYFKGFSIFNHSINNNNILKFNITGFLYLFDKLIGFDFKSARGSGSKFINNFNIPIYKEKILSKKRDLSGKKKKSESDLDSFLNFPIRYLILLPFIFKDNNILYNNKFDLKGYFLWNSLINFNILI